MLHENFQILFLFFMCVSGLYMHQAHAGPMEAKQDLQFPGTTDKDGC